LTSIRGVADGRWARFELLRAHGLLHESLHGGSKFSRPLTVTSCVFGRPSVVGETGVPGPTP